MRPLRRRRGCKPFCLTVRAMIRALPHTPLQWTLTERTMRLVCGPGTHYGFPRRRRLS